MTGVVLDAIEDSGLTRAELARVLGTTKSYVSQVLNGSTNMTLKTLGGLLWATGKQVQNVTVAVTGSNEQYQRGSPGQWPRVGCRLGGQCEQHQRSSPGQRQRLGCRLGGQRQQHQRRAG